MEKMMSQDKPFGGNILNSSGKSAALRKWHHLKLKEKMDGAFFIIFWNISTTLMSLRGNHESKFDLRHWYSINA